MSSPYDRPLRFKLNILRTYQAWFIALHTMAALLVIFFTALSLTLKLALLLALSFTLFWQWQKLPLLPRFLIRQNELDWVFEDQNGNVTSASLAAGSYVSAWLVILHFVMTEDERCSVVVLPHMLEKNSYRQLCAYLRMTNLESLADE